MERILVIGASRGIGLQVVRQGLERGLRVRAMARSAEGMAEAEGLERFPGDATDAQDLTRALEEQEAVILALGVPPGLGFVYRPVTLFSRATGALLPLMEEQGPRRLLAVTGFGAGDSNAALSMLERVPFRAIMGRAYDDKTRQEEAIRASALDWTIARPGILTNGPRTGRYKVLTEPSEWRNGMIARADVAEFLLDAAQTESHLREAPVLVR